MDQKGTNRVWLQNLLVLSFKKLINIFTSYNIFKSLMQEGYCQSMKKCF